MTAQGYRFGPYELRSRARELTKHGIKVKLRAQPFQILKALVERAGDVLTREELRELLWPKETFVDFEHGLNAAMSELRAVLNDAASDPRYIETLPKVGYRIKVPIERVEREDQQATIKKAADPIPILIPIGSSTEVSDRLHNPTSPSPHPAVWTSITRRNAFLTLAAVAVALGIGAILWIHKTEFFWRNPIANARFQTVTDFDGTEQAATVSRDGHFVAFLSDRDGTMDVWVTQVGSGQFHNLTHGNAAAFANPSLRTLGFTPDGSLVTFWVRKQSGSNGANIGIWGVPTLGGQPTLYLQGVAEYEWSPDSTRLVYHTPGTGDPLFVSEGKPTVEGRPIYNAPAGLHGHFPSWSPDGAFIYFVQGTIPDKLDIWRIPSSGGNPERITSHKARVSHPVFLDPRTLLYLASDPDGSGPWLYSMDVNRRKAHRLESGADRYTSLAAGADGRRLVVTVATAKRTLWRLRISDSPAQLPPQRISLNTGTGFSPRLGPNYLLYVSTTNTGESVWKFANGSETELWNGQGARIFGGPAVSPDGRNIAFSVRQHGKSLLYMMQADGTHARILNDTLDLLGGPAWAPDGQSITTAAEDHGVTQLFQIPIDGHPASAFVKEYALDPAWSLDGQFVVYSGPDIGTTFSLKAVTAAATRHAIPSLTLTRGARHLSFLAGGHTLVLLRGELNHKDLWLIDLETGAERQLTNFPYDFDVGDFDISPDGREVVLERVQERSEVLLMDLPGR